MMIMNTKVKGNFYSQNPQSFLIPQQVVGEFWKRPFWEDLICGCYLVSSDLDRWELEPTNPNQPEKIFIFARKKSENKTPLYLGQFPYPHTENLFKYLSGLQKVKNEEEKELYLFEVSKKYFHLELFQDKGKGLCCVIRRSPLKTAKNKPQHPTNLRGLNVDFTTTKRRGRK
jgi:hypothetical protein